MPNNFFYNAQVCRLSAASLSCLASITIAIMILRSDGGLASSPYRRIIFGLSIGDILQSLGIFLGPFASPIDTPNALWAEGNLHSCDAAGFILVFGGSMVPLYTFSLSLYFLLRVKYRMSRADFAKRVEWIIHTMIISFCLIGSGIILVTGSFNATRAGSLCAPVAYPLGCDTQTDLIGECTRGRNALIFFIVFYYLPSFLSFIGMIVCLGTLTQYVYAQEAKLRKATSAQNQDLTKSCCRWTKHRSGIVEDNDNEELCPQGQRIRRARENLRSFSRETLVQSGLYMFAFLTTYSFLFIWLFMSLSGAEDQRWTFLAISVTWPLGGLFNILVYTRPKVAVLKASYPTYPWILMLFTVVMAGGEVPDEIDLNPQEILSVDLSGVDAEEQAVVFPVSLPSDDGKEQKGWSVQPQDTTDESTRDTCTGNMTRSASHHDVNTMDQ